MKFKVEQILPTDIYRFQYPNIDELESISNNLRNEKYVSNKVNYRTESSKLHKCEKYKKLHDWFHACLDVVKNKCEYTCDELKITNSWANRYQSGQYSQPHIHTNSVVSGIFYFEKIDVPTFFLQKDSWMVGMTENCFYSSASSLYLSKEESDGRYLAKEIKPDYGTLCLFPSSMIHGCNPTKKSRYTLAFNSYPSGRIGGDDYFCINVETK